MGLYLVLPHLPRVSRLFCCLVVPLPPFIILLIFLVLWDWLLLPARSLWIGTCTDSCQASCQHGICQTVLSDVKAAGIYSTHGYVLNAYTICKM
jgi:hypothetical protein